MKDGALNVSRSALEASGGWQDHAAHSGEFNIARAAIPDVDQYRHRQLDNGLDDEAKLNGALLDRFVVPPFSVLDTRQGYWRDRRRWWLSLGIKSELGRGLEGIGAIPMTGMAGDFNVAMRSKADARAFAQDLMRGETRAAADARSNVTGAPPLPEWADNGMTNMAPGTSIFDPVLCELAYRWFCPPGGTVLDPFAGGSVRGIVAGYLGHPYTGIDLSARQVAANYEQAAEILPPDDPARPQPKWIVGDSHLALPVAAEPESMDLIFSCPPYYDLEVYSDDPRDLSNLSSYEQFREMYRGIIAKAAERLAPGRFACFVVSEIRAPDGHFRGFVPDTIEAFRAAGMRYYNEAILVNPAGSLPIRITKQFEASRKVGRTHQNVLVFLKGEHPRGWSYERDDPPDPQMPMFGDDDLLEDF